MTKEKNIYLDALEFGEKCLKDGKDITYNDLKKHLEHIGYSFDTEAKDRLLKDMSRETFHIYIENGEEWKNKPHYINTEGYFKLLEYRELKDARKSSKEARWYAIIAIGISIMALLASIYFSIKELQQTTTINSEQFGVIENILRLLESR